MLFLTENHCYIVKTDKSTLNHPSKKELRFLKESKDFTNNHAIEVKKF